MYLVVGFFVTLFLGTATSSSFPKPLPEELTSRHKVDTNQYGAQYNQLTELLRKYLWKQKIQRELPPSWHHDKLVIRRRQKSPKRSLRFQFQPDIYSLAFHLEDKFPKTELQQNVRLQKKSYTPDDHQSKYQHHTERSLPVSNSGHQNIAIQEEIGIQNQPDIYKNHKFMNSVSFQPLGYQQYNGVHGSGGVMSHYQHQPLPVLSNEPHLIDMTKNQDEYETMISNYIYGSQPIGLDLKSTRSLISLGVGIIIVIVIASMVLAMRLHYRNRERDGNQWINHPSVRPTTATPGGIQPGYPSYLGQSEPIRIKAKGLLERRGSNTSLTIDLGGSTGECGDSVFSPSRECTPEDFLLTAGSRMSRLQLRQSLRNSKLLHAEFWQIPSNHPERCTVPGAASKNRYRTVLPNEGSRVILHKAFDDSPEIPSSQYINANYIRGYDGEDKAYIATQGPLAHTIEDLWILVLQMKSPALVMITRLKEKGRVKCEAYIPTYAASYGSVHVTVKQVIQKNGYTIRQILVKRGEDVHTTLHFWFTSWPDHKTPSSARHILAMAAEVEAARKDPRKGPIIVHCSAGIGRTGCFIAISIGMIQLLEENCVDILSSVCQMRLDRGGMVQTAEQYEFIYRALALYEASLPLSAATE